MPVPTDELTRLSTGAPTGYNNDPYNASTNPYGFDDGGYINNFFAAFVDFTTVTLWVTDEIAPIVAIATEIEDLGAIVSELQTIAGVAPDIQTLAALDTELTALGAITGDVSTVASNMTAVTAVATDIAKVAAVEAKLTEIEAVADDLADIAAVLAMEADIDTVVARATDIATLADIEDGTTATGAIQTVAGIATAVSNVSANSADVVAVAGDLSDINTLAGISSAVSALGPIAADIEAVGDITADVETVAANIADVQAAPAAAVAARKSVRHIIFDSGTADAHPGSGHWRLSFDPNAATVGQTGWMYHDITDADAGTITEWIESWDDVINATGRGNISLVCETDPSISLMLRVTGAVSSGTLYRKIPVTLLQKSIVGGSITDEMEFTEVFAANGNDGGGGGGGVAIVGGVAAGELMQAADSSGDFIEGAGKAIADLFDKTADTLDDVPDGSTYVKYTGAEQTKLAGIEAAADVTDAGNVGAAINGSTAKTTPVNADRFAFWDAAASVLKYVTWQNLLATAKTYFDTLYSAVGHSHALSDITSRTTTYASDITGLTGKTTPVDADQLAIIDSAASNVLKKLTWANLKATLFAALGWTPASSSGPASLDFPEDTDNGTNKVTVKAPSSLSADRTVTWPDASMTFAAFMAGLMDNANLDALAADLGITIASNANGSYARFPNGLQVCWGVVASGTINSSNGSVFISGPVTWTFPAAFSAAPKVTATAIRTSGSGVVWAADGGSSISTTAYSGVRGASSITGPTADVNLIAVGTY